MTPAEKQKIENTIRTWESLGYDREEIIDGTARETGVSKEIVAAVCDKLFPSAAPIPGPEVASVQEPKTPFETRALPLIERGVPVVPLKPESKIAFITGWEQKASNNPAQIQQWAAQFPDANVASVAKAQLDGFWFFEVDKANFQAVVEQQTGQKMPETFMVRSSPGRGHFYFKQTAASIAMGNRQGKDENGKEAWSARVDDRYVVGPRSIHPTTKKNYEVVNNAPIVEAPDWLVQWCSNNRADKSEHAPTGKTNAAYVDDGGDIVEGSRNNALTSILGKKHQDEGWDQEQLYAYGLEVNDSRVKPPLPESEVRTIARSVAKYPVVPKTPVVFNAYGQATPIVAAPAVETTIDLSDENRIPAFDETVVTGIYRDIVDLAVGGTTIPPQFAFLNAKVYLGARMAGKVTFEGLDCDSSYYGVAIGVTGTSKGESWRRTFERVLNPPELTTLKPQLKVIYSADSGAGLKDAFFEPPTELPIVCYIDEVTDLGHKAGEKKNPEILNTIIELADSHRISRVKAKHGKEKSAKTHDNARLSVFVCGQDGPAFMGAFAGRTKLGLFDRLYPEFSGSIEAGDLPEIKQSDIENLQTKINRLNFNCKMTMSATTESKLKEFWNGQPGDIRRKIRFKKYLMLDMYMAAFGRGVTVAEPEDLEVAIKIFNRQMVIRQVCFTGEVPDRVGFYASKIKAIIEVQRKELNNGKTVAQVAKSLRDFQTLANAFRDNELHTFERAWKSFSEHVVQVPVMAGNGQKYFKWVPMPYEHETWLQASAA